METKKSCVNCGHELDVGVDVIKVDEGVIGMRDFVPLGKALFFCCEKCIGVKAKVIMLPWVDGCCG